ncbi:MAG: hypothetical protein IJP01_04550, partial [Oscillospiraceae bacterium]|nr:hypothetical protein [Oscillospiraceae bacterium]
ASGGLGGTGIGAVKGFGKEAAEEIAKEVVEEGTSALARKLLKDRGALVLFTWAQNALGEGMEEFFTTELQAPIKLLYDEAANTGRPAADIFREMKDAWSDALYSALVGSITGAVMGSPNALRAGNPAKVQTQLANELVRKGVMTQAEAFTNGKPSDVVVQMYETAVEGQQLKEQAEAPQPSQQPASEPVQPAVTQPTEQEAALQQAVKPAQSESGFSPEEQAQLDVLLPKQLDNDVVRRDNEEKIEENDDGLSSVQPRDTANDAIYRGAAESSRGDSSLAMDGTRRTFSRSGEMAADDQAVDSGTDSAPAAGDVGTVSGLAETVSEFDARMASAGYLVYPTRDGAVAVKPTDKGTENALRAHQLLTAFGVPSFLFDAPKMVNREGVTEERERSQASLLPDEKMVAVSNNLQLPAEVAAFHEAFHYHYRHGNRAAAELLDAVWEQGVDVNEPQVVTLTNQILKDYPDTQKDFADSPYRFFEELTSYVAGELYCDKKRLLSEHSYLFNDWHGIIQAFDAFRNDIDKANAPADAEAFSDAQTPEDVMFSHFEQQLQADEDAKRAADQARQQDVQQLAEAISPDAAVFREAPKGKVVGKVDGVDVYASDLSGDAKYTGVKMLGNKLGRQVVIVKSLPHNADGAWANGTIYISESVADGKLLHTLLKHELTHSLRGAKLWNKFEAYTLQQFEAREGSEKFNALREKL